MFASRGEMSSYAKVMTDEQVETLRKQIAVYATISEQLIEMHNALSARKDISGGRVGNVHGDALMQSSCHKISPRQRWTPTPLQLQILERLFDHGNGTPSKQKIKEITFELSRHGQISETNVYNWFQNRRARSKRKQLVVSSNNAESEAETEVDSPNGKVKQEFFHSALPPHNALLLGELHFQKPELSPSMHLIGDEYDPGKMIGASLPRAGSFNPLVCVGEYNIA